MVFLLRVILVVTTHNDRFHYLCRLFHIIAASVLDCHVVVELVCFMTCYRAMRYGAGGPRFRAKFRCSALGFRAVLLRADHRLRPNKGAEHSDESPGRSERDSHGICCEETLFALPE